MRFTKLSTSDAIRRTSHPQTFWSWNGYRCPWRFAISPVLSSSAAIVMSFRYTHKTSGCALFVMLQLFHMCIIAMLLHVSSVSPIIVSIRPRPHLTCNTRNVLELETLSSATATTVAQLLLEQIQGYEKPLIHAGGIKSKNKFNGFAYISQVYSRNIINPPTQGNDQAIILSPLHLSSILGIV